MNVEDVLERTLSERAEEAPPGEKVLQRVLARPKERRRWWPAAVSVVATAGVVAAAVVALGGDERAVVAPAPSVADTPTPTWSTDGFAPYGPTRTLVYRGVELQVPAEWRLLRFLHCGAVSRDAVVVAELLPRVIETCGIRDSFEHGYVEVRQPYQGEATKGQSFDLGGEASFARVSKPSECESRVCFGPPDGTVSGVLTLPDRRVVIEVHTLDRSLTEAILASVHLRDMSDVLVPDLRGLRAQDAERRLIRLGLSPQLTMGRGFVQRSSPDPGSPAPPDGVVKLTIARVHFQSAPDG